MLLYVVLLYYIYTLLYIGKRKRQTEERANWKKTGRRMPPTSRQFLASPSAPSAASIVHTIASRSQLRPPCASAHGEGRAATSSASGRCHRHTSQPPRNRSTSKQQRQSSASGCRPSCPPRLFLPLLQVVKVWQSKRTSRREGRERTSAKDAADIFASSSSVCCPHRPRPRPFFPSVFVCRSCYSSP